MIQKVFIYFGLFFIFSGCKKNDLDTLRNYSPKFVVEGSIENGQFPHVIITHNLPFFTSVDSAQLNEIVIRYAKVTVSDGVNTEILTGGTDPNYFPSFVYKGNEIKGEIGKTYNLTIEYAGFTLTAQTTIPKPVALSKIWFVPKENDKQQLQIQFFDNSSEKNYYKLYTKLDSGKRFIPTLLSNYDDKFFNGKVYILQVNRAPENNLTVKSDAFFNTGDTVLVKFASIDKASYDFWSSFQDEVLNSSNPLIGSTGKIKSNINGMGIGIWCGYGSTIYKVVAKQ
jgi:hypothetical protein